MTQVLSMLGSPLDAAQLLQLFGHFLMLSLLAVGGAISTAPDMHRFIVGEQGWLTDPQFTASIALAQAAPGPNVLFVAVIGWTTAGLPGLLACMLGILLPSTTAALYATRWGDARKDARIVRAFKLGLAPLTIGLTLATGWILASSSSQHLGGLVLVVLATLAFYRLSLSPVLLIAVGAVVGALGLA